MSKRITLSLPFHFFLLIGIAFHLAEATVPALFVFGDSTVDVGTNTFLPDSLAKANYPYYGIDFPGSVPTGRFSNGYNGADNIAELLGFEKSPLAYLHLLNHTGSFKQGILHGVNFASGGSGILNDTGFKIFVNIVPMREQVQQFSSVAGNLSEQLGPGAAARTLSESLFLISIGSNDLIEYQLEIPDNASYNKLEPKEFLGILVSTYRNHLLSLFRLGARKFGIVSIGPIGCCPLERALFSKGHCEKDINDLAQAFFNATEILLRNLSSELEGMKYSVGNAYDIAYDIIVNPSAAGFKEAKNACCGDGPFNGITPCTVDAKLCPNRTEYLFWDAVHLSAAATKLFTRTLFRGGVEYVRPMNFSRLVED